MYQYHKLRAYWPFLNETGEVARLTLDRGVAITGMFFSVAACPSFLTPTTRVTCSSHLRFLRVLTLAPCGSGAVSK